MDTYSLERLTLERHAEVARAAEESSRRRGWAPQPLLAGLLASRLRVLADRLDGRDARERTDARDRGFTVVSGSR
jgi:hypothetical protein